ncbi:MAG TPA: cytochrome-c oxidase, cbb3-type subunit III [Arenibaculum sp.]|nr:cytochrome-c oxidase, cbb3-type subunit III [Arenibaculum sp.]
MPTKIEKDAVTGVETTGHEWDGLRELNNPLPRWWLYTFYATIAACVVYWVLYPSWPTLSGHTEGLLGYSRRDVVVREIALAREGQSAFLDRIATAGLPEIQADPELLNFAMAGGRTAFADNCAGCHGAGGAGAAGYPSLADDEWIWGGTLDDIHLTLEHGVRWTGGETRIADMPRFGADRILDKVQIDDIAEYVLSLTGTVTDEAERGKPLFADNCAACHGDAGEGNREMGAPALNDAIWLYGGTKKAIVAQINAPRHGQMPAWSGRLDPVTLKQLAIYVHGLGGGE